MLTEDTFKVCTALLSTDTQAETGITLLFKLEIVIVYLFAFLHNFLHVLILAAVTDPSVSPKMGLMVMVYSVPELRPWIM